jgi:hypothetical protein
VIGCIELDDLKAYMIETMCTLVMCFPPSFFFDMQEHLMIHLVDQILTLGHYTYIVYFRMSGSWQF